MASCTKYIKPFMRKKGTHVRCHFMVIECETMSFLLNIQTRFMATLYYQPIKYFQMCLNETF